MKIQTREEGSCQVVAISGSADIGASGLLIIAYLKAQNRGGFVRLAAPQGRLLEILETTRLNPLFEVFPDVASAAASEQAAGA